MQSNPNSRGNPVERIHQDLRRALLANILQNDKKWAASLKEKTFALNSSRGMDTFSPLELLTGSQPPLPADVAKSPRANIKVRDDIEGKLRRIHKIRSLHRTFSEDRRIRRTMQRDYNLKSIESYKIGDTVLVRATGGNKYQDGSWLDGFVITKLFPGKPNVYEVTNTITGKKSNLPLLYLRKDSDYFIRGKVIPDADNSSSSEPQEAKSSNAAQEAKSSNAAPNNNRYPSRARTKVNYDALGLVHS